MALFSVNGCARYGSGRPDRLRNEPVFANRNPRRVVMDIGGSFHIVFMFGWQLDTHDVGARGDNARDKRSASQAILSCPS